MTDNVLQFSSFSKATRASVPSIEAAAAAPASSVVQLSPGSKKRSQSTGFPKMAVLTGGVSADISLNERLRKRRDRRWQAAEAKVEVLRAKIKIHFLTMIADANYSAMLKNFRKARMDLLLTPAPRMRSLLWKRRCVARLNEWDWVGVKPARVERALADDEAFLKAHPTRHCRHRPLKAQAAEIVEPDSDHRPVPSTEKPTEAEAGCAPLAAHSDATLIELGVEYERLLAIEQPLRAESDRLWEVACRLPLEKMGIDPEDDKARCTALNERYDEWIEARNLAGKETGHDKASSKTLRASNKTVRIGRKILKIKPATTAGLLVRLSVIATHDEICKTEPLEALQAEIRGFAKRLALVQQA